jgi:hypothetical protein
MKARAATAAPFFFPMTGGIRLPAKVARPSCLLQVKRRSGRRHLMDSRSAAREST